MSASIHALCFIYFMQAAEKAAAAAAAKQAAAAAAAEQAAAEQAAAAAAAEQAAAEQAAAAAAAEQAAAAAAAEKEQAQQEQAEHVPLNALEVCAAIKNSLALHQQPPKHLLQAAAQLVDDFRQATTSQPSQWLALYHEDDYDMDELRLVTQPWEQPDMQSQLLNDLEAVVAAMATATQPAQVAVQGLPEAEAAAGTATQSHGDAATTPSGQSEQQAAPAEVTVPSAAAAASGSGAASAGPPRRSERVGQRETQKADKPLTTTEPSAAAAASGSGAASAGPPRRSERVAWAEAEREAAARGRARETGDTVSPSFQRKIKRAALGKPGTAKSLIPPQPVLLPTQRPQVIRPAPTVLPTASSASATASTAGAEQPQQPVAQLTFTKPDAGEREPPPPGWTPADVYRVFDKEQRHTQL